MEETSLPCEAKIKFATQAEAKASATVAGYRYGGSRSVYVCKHCNLWHISSS